MAKKSLLKSKVLCVVNPKGGQAKTFSALSLAAEACYRGGGKKKILLVDADPSFDATKFSIELDDEVLTSVTELPYTLADCLKDPSFDVNKAIYGCSTQFPGLQILAGSSLLDEPEKAFGHRKNIETVLKRMLSNLEYDLIIIDTPANMGLMTQIALVAADAYVSPSELELGGLDGIMKIFNKINTFIDEEVLEESPKFVGFFLTKVEPRTKEYRIGKEQLNGLIKAKVFKKGDLILEIPKAASSKEARWFATTLQFNRTNPICKLYAKIFNRILETLKIKF